MGVLVSRYCLYILDRKREYLRERSGRHFINFILHITNIIIVFHFQDNLTSPLLHLNSTWTSGCILPLSTLLSWQIPSSNLCLTPHQPTMLILLLPPTTPVNYLTFDNKLRYIIPYYRIFCIDKNICRVS